MKSNYQTSQSYYSQLFWLAAGYEATSSDINGYTHDLIIEQHSWDNSASRAETQTTEKLKK